MSAIFLAGRRKQQSVSNARQAIRPSFDTNPSKASFEAGLWICATDTAPTSQASRLHGLHSWWPPLGIRGASGDRARAVCCSTSGVSHRAFCNGARRRDPRKAVPCRSDSTRGSPPTMTILRSVRPCALQLLLRPPIRRIRLESGKGTCA
jgi:hypothetical protein